MSLLTLAAFVSLICSRQQGRDREKLMSRINGFVGRRNFLQFVGLGSLTLATGSVTSQFQQACALQTAFTEPSQTKPNPVSANQALKQLLDGNKRFVRRQKRECSKQLLERVQLTAQAQYPFASILGCADSRVPVEIVFDQGFGDLFVVRVAGNVASDTAIGSLEYATAVLGSQLIMVLGHKKCGAVAKAIQEEPIPGRIGFIVEGIRPAVTRLKSTTGNIEEDAVLANIRYQVEKLQESSAILAKLVHQGKLKVVGAHYDLETGKVSLVG